MFPSFDRAAAALAAMLHATVAFIGLCTVMFTVVVPRSTAVTLERTVHVSPSLIESVDIRLLYITDRPQIYMPRPHQSSDAILVAILLLLGGIESNPGPIAASR